MQITELIQINMLNQTLQVPKQNIPDLMCQLSKHCHLDAIHKDDYKHYVNLLMKQEKKRKK